MHLPDQVKIVKLELDKTLVKEEFAREHIEATMTGVSNSLQEETIALDCIRRYCTKGAGGAKWKTPVLTQMLAFKQLKLHMVKYHGYQDAEAARDNHSEKVEDNATRVRYVTVTGVDENGRLTVQLPDIPSQQHSGGHVDVHEHGAAKHKGYYLPAGGGLGGAPDGEEVQPGEVQRPVLKRGCSVKQFNSFKLDWDKFSEQYKSRYREEHEEENGYMINYQLLDCLPRPIEDEIYKILPLGVETISMANLLMVIKRIIVREAVKQAQQSVVQSVKVPAVEPVQDTVEDEVV